MRDWEGIVRVGWRIGRPFGARERATTSYLAEMTRLLGVRGGHTQERIWLAGAPGFEPGDGGIKIRCLTTWLRPNDFGILREARGPYRRAESQATLRIAQRPARLRSLRHPVI
jgi:hypothetical protein